MDHSVVVEEGSDTERLPAIADGLAGGAGAAGSGDGALEFAPRPGAAPFGAGAGAAAAGDATR